MLILKIMKLFNQVLLLLSSALLVLHSFVPHEHHSDMPTMEHEQQHRDASSWLEWLELAFHADLSPNHLQDIPELPTAEYQHSQQQQMQTVEVAALLHLFATPTTAQPIVAVALNTQSRFSAFPPPLRAPPLFA